MFFLMILMIVENIEFWFSKDSHWNSGINNPFQYKKSSTSKIYFIYFGVDFLVLISCTEIDYNTIIAVWILFFSFIISFLFCDGKVWSVTEKPFLVPFFKCLEL